MCVGGGGLVYGGCVTERGGGGLPCLSFGAVTEKGGGEVLV